MSQLCPNCEVPSRTLALLDPPPAASPNLAHLLTSNEPPLESEVPFIHKAIADAQGRIQPLDEQIGSLKAQIHDLPAALFQFRSRRDEVAENVRRHQSVISPIRRVPAELICEIFLAVSLPDDAVNKPPWYLGHICRSWREYALAYSCLWMSLTVDVGSSVIRTISRLKAQVLWSANGPLDIHWRCAHHSLLDLLLPHSARWRNLRFDDWESTDFDWLTSVTGCLDRLQKLHFEIPATPRYDFPDIFLTARDLRAVILTDGSFFLSQTIAIPWEQISHYHGTYSPERQLQILRAAASTLVEGVVGFTGDDFGDEPPHNLTLPNLRRLSLEYVAILPHLKAPILEELRLIFGHEPMSSLYLFIHRSSCKLTRLALIKCQIDSELMSLLLSLPTLRSLLLDLEYDVHEVGRSDWIVAMSMSGSPTDICPSLTTFEFGYKSATQIVWDVFVAMARSRFHAHSSSHCRLSHLRLFAGRSSSSDNVDAHMVTLRNDGFDAVLLDRDDMSKSLF